MFVVDKEELRADKAVKVTRKELNNLIAELFEFTDTFSEQEEEILKKRKSPENSCPSVEDDTMVRNKLISVCYLIYKRKTSFLGSFCSGFTTCL